MPAPVLTFLTSCAPTALQMVTAASANEADMHRDTLKASVRALEVKLEAHRLELQAEVARDRIEADRQLGLAAIQMSRAIFEKKSNMLGQW